MDELEQRISEKQIAEKISQFIEKRDSGQAPTPSGDDLGEDVGRFVSEVVLDDDPSLKKESAKELVREKLNLYIKASIADYKRRKPERFKGDTSQKEKELEDMLNKEIWEKASELNQAQSKEEYLKAKEAALEKSKSIVLEAIEKAANDVMKGL